MNYQGNNQFTKVVKALKFVQDQFEHVSKYMDKVDCGLTKIQVENLLATALSPDSKRSSRKRRQTIIDALEVRLNVSHKRSILP